MRRLQTAANPPGNRCEGSKQLQILPGTGAKPSNTCKSPREPVQRLQTAANFPGNAINASSKTPLAGTHGVKASSKTPLAESRGVKASSKTPLTESRGVKASSKTQLAESRGVNVSSKVPLVAAQAHTAPESRTPPTLAGLRPGYGTVSDQADVSPDSNPSLRIGTANRCAWMLLELVSVPLEPVLSQTTTKSPSALTPTTGICWKPVT